MVPPTPHDSANEDDVFANLTDDLGEAETPLFAPSTVPTGGSGEWKPPKAGDIVHGRFDYRIQKQLGTGGFGLVCLAETLNDGSGGDAAEPPPPQVAIKFFHAPGSSASMLMKRELSSVLALRHDRIPRLHDWNANESSVFTVMDYFPAGSLKDSLPFTGPLCEEATWRLLADLLSALSAAHRACVLHLDIKPANVLLDGNGGFVLTDFGISQGSFVSRGVLPSGLGTLYFQSPEQRMEAHESFDVRTDLWGVGITAWSACTGITAFSRPELHRLPDSGATHGLPSLRQFRADASPELDAVIMDMLAFDASNRPGSADEVLVRVQNHASRSGFDSRIMAAACRGGVDDIQMAELLESLLDPLWSSVCRAPGFERYIARYSAGDILCREGERSYQAFLLLKGRVEVRRGDRHIITESREGVFIGEVATLIGGVRTATLAARGEVWVALFNAAELERFVTCNPAVGIRLIKSLAERVARESAAE